jgi:hypothetical protein
MEGSFGDATRCHGFKRARWRGLQKQSIQDYLIAACQNLRILCSKGWYLKTHEAALAASSQLPALFSPLLPLFQHLLRAGIAVFSSDSHPQSEGHPTA